MSVFLDLLDPPRQFGPQPGAKTGDLSVSDLTNPRFWMLDAIAGGVNPRARCVPVANPGNARLAWDVQIDPAAEPRDAPPELKLAKISRGATFRFEQRRALRF